MAVPRINEDLMKSFMEIQLGEESGSSNLVHIPPEVWQRIQVQLGLHVQGAIVSDWSEAAPGLRGQVERGAPSGWLARIHRFHNPKVNELFPRLPTLHGLGTPR